MRGRRARYRGGLKDARSAGPFENFPRKHDRLVCVDSDGTALDTMEIKHNECFIPNTIRFWDLQPVARYARRGG